MEMHFALRVIITLAPTTTTEYPVYTLSVVNFNCEITCSMAGTPCSAGRFRLDEDGWGWTACMSCSWSVLACILAVDKSVNAETVVMRIIVMTNASMRIVTTTTTTGCNFDNVLCHSLPLYSGQAPLMMDKVHKQCGHVFNYGPTAAESFNLIDNGFGELYFGLEKENG